MGRREQLCSGLEIDEARFGAEFREIVNALFCACLRDMEPDTDGVAREIFRRVELEDQPLSVAAAELGLPPARARAMLEKTRRDIAVLLALGLCQPLGEAGQPGGGRTGCGCG